MAYATSLLRSQTESARNECHSVILLAALSSAAQELVLVHHLLSAGTQTLTLLATHVVDKNDHGMYFSLT